jgi:hypothetical protein
MKKSVLFLVIFFIASSLLFGQTSSSQTKNFPSLGWTTPNFDRDLVFDQYSGACPLTRIRIETSVSATGFEINIDNDGENPGNCTCWCGVTCDLTSSDVVLKSSGSTAPDVFIGSDVSAASDSTYSLTANDGDPTDQVDVDFDYDDYKEFNGDDETATDDGDVHSDYWAAYSGTGTFTINAAATTNFGTTGLSGVNYTAITGTAQGWVRITYYWDCALPVELSEFAAVQNAENLAQLTWIVQSESEIMGYNVYRSLSNSVDSAYQVNTDIIDAINSAEEHTYNFTDETAEYDTYYYWLEVVENDGSTEFSEAASITIIEPDEDYKIPVFVSLSGIQSIYPNPFNPSVNVSYYLNEQADVYVEVYNMKGRKVYEFNEGSKSAGVTHNIVWNGQNSENETVSTGIYLFKLKAGSLVEIKKAIMGK